MVIFIGWKKSPQHTAGEGQNASFQRKTEIHPYINQGHLSFLSERYQKVISIFVTLCLDPMGKL